MSLSKQIRGTFMAVSLGVTALLGGCASAPVTRPEITPAAAPATKPEGETAKTPTPDAVKKADPKKKKGEFKADISLFPSLKHSKTTDAFCVITDKRSGDFGAILDFILPLTPFFDMSDSTKLDGACWDRLFAEQLLNKRDKQHHLYAVSIYDQLKPGERKKIDELLKTKGTSIDEIGKDWPRITSFATKKNCTTIRYKMPEDESGAVDIKCWDRPSRKASDGHRVPTP